MKIFSYPRKIEEWRRKTAGMSLEERGIYSELIDWYYCTGSQLTYDINALCRMVGATKRNEREAVKRIVDNPALFSVKDGLLVQKMCDETLSFMAQKSSKASESANSRWSKNNDITNANALPTHSEGNANYKLETKEVSKEEKKDSKKAGAVAPSIFQADGFSEFWKTYPRKVARANAEKAYLSALKGGSTHGEIMAGLARYVPIWAHTEVAYIPHAATWLNGKRWNDEQDPDGPKPKPPNNPRPSNGSGWREYISEELGFGDPIPPALDL